MIPVGDEDSSGIMRVPSETDPQEVVVSEFEISEGDRVNDVSGILSDCILECPENVGVVWVVVGIAV